jgi:hypothetical protein
MRRLTGAHVLVLALLFTAAGCGGSGTAGGGDDGLTMSFQGFTGEDIEQADAVFDGSAQVDLCRDFCLTSGGGGGGEPEPEPFTSTFVSARFVNRGKADIHLDGYTLFVPGSGVPEAVRSLGATLPGGRCSGPDDQKPCVFNSECGGGLCSHQETLVSVLLFDFDFKTRVNQGVCPFDVIPQTLDVEMTFTGTDETGERFTISTGYGASFANFDNCEDQ